MKQPIMNAMLAALLLSTGISTAHAEEKWSSWLFSIKRFKEVAPVTDATYNKECGSCHFPYQPGWLPARSWERLMDPKALEDHFGDNAELDEETRKPLLDLLIANSAEKSWRKRSRKIMASLGPNDAPLRITEVSSIHRAHEEIPENLIKGNAKVKSLAQCGACHTKAMQGNFDDDTVVIPGHGYWTR